MPQSRQLAAIMFTDIVGYTALMGNDEQKAFELLKKNRELQKPIIVHLVLQSVFLNQLKNVANNKRIDTWKRSVY